MIAFDSNVPIYMQILEFLKKRIASSKIMPGEKLPSVREMAQMFNVNPNTIQRVIQELEREGLIFTERGIGSFVTKNMDVIYDLKEKMASQIIENFMKSMNDIGFSDEDIINLINKKIRKEV